MTINDMKSAVFPQASFDAWKDEAVRTLNGKPFDRLMTPTFEGIELQPLYTAQHVQKVLNYSNIVSQDKQAGQWLVAQRTTGLTAKEFLHNTKEQLKLGNDVIVYAGTSTPFTWSDEELQELAELLKENPFYISAENPNDAIIRVFSFLSTQECGNLDGFINGLPVTIGKKVVSTRELHHSGGTAVHELTYALMELSYIAEKETNFHSKVAVQFSIDTNFFMEIAKLRAFRVLWLAFSKAYNEKHTPIPVMAETSLRSYSTLDPTVNLLRAGNATFSAVLGGADIITVHPHDLLTGSTPISERIARNVQLVIREETMVNKIIDPSAGSYYVESLTADLVQQAWALFLSIGELDKTRQTEHLMSLAKEVQNKRNQALSERKASLIGTNIYANPADDATSILLNTRQDRLAIPFEKLREHFTKNPFKTAVVSFGVLKDVKPRADFVQGFLQAGGLNPEMSPVFTTAENAWHWVKTNGFDYVVVAAKEEMVNEIVPQILQMSESQTKIDVAGKFKDIEQWKALGLNGNIFVGQDLVEKMHQLIEIQKEGK